MSAIFDNTKTVYLPTNTGGIMVQVDPATPVDNIFVFASGAYKFKWVNNVKGVYPLSQAKILSGDATDKTSILQTILNNDSIDTIVLDAQQTVVISGTLNSKGKTIRFTPGSKFTGTATINNAIIDAEYTQQLFDTTISLTNCNVSRDMFSVIWYGAVNDDSADASLAIQKTVNTVIANQGNSIPQNMKTIFFPSGSYLINHPIILYKWDGAAYRQFTINLFGEFDYAGTYPNGTRINCNFNDTFAFGIQQGKSCKIEGFYFQGQFNPPPLGNGYSWYSLTLIQFTDGVSRDSQYSPYSAIVIDPFTNGAVPADGGYLPLTSYYRGDNSQSGSSGIYIRNCFMTNFVVGVMNSPNGVTRNGELTFIERNQFANCKVCVSGTQDQEKANKVYDLMCWSNTHTIFATGLYGSQIPGNWYAEIINLAGAVNQIVYNNGLGYYPSHFEKVFAESTGKIGFLGTNLQSSFKNSVIDLQRFDPGGGYPVGAYDWVITGYNTLFENCVIRYYGTAYPVAILGRMVFRNCYFEDAPYCPSGILNDGLPYGIDAYGPSVFQNCTVDSVQFNDTQDSISQMSSLTNYIVYDKKKFIDKSGYRQGSWTELELDGGETCTYEYWAATFNQPPFTVVIDSNRNSVINVTSDHINKFQLNRPVIFDGNGLIFGIVTNVNTGTNEITVSYIPSAATNGSYHLGCIYSKRFKGAFIGDFTAGSPTVSNIVLDTWGNNPADIVGEVIEVSQIINFSFLGKYQNLVRVLAYDSGAKTITLEMPANLTMAAQYCTVGIGIKKLVRYADAPVLVSFPNTTIVPEKSMIYVGSNQYLVTKTGFINAATIGGGETRQAQWVKLGQQPQEFADDASADLMGVRIYYNITSNVVKIKNNTSWLTVTAS